MRYDEIAVVVKLYATALQLQDALTVRAISRARERQYAPEPIIQKHNALAASFHKETKKPVTKAGFDRTQLPDCGFAAELYKRTRQRITIFGETIRAAYILKRYHGTRL